MSSRRFPRTLLAVSVIAGLACAAAWLLPPVKPGGVLGRLSYPEFLLALVLSGLFATSLIVLLSSGASRRAVAIRLGLLWLGGLVALIATEASAVYMPVNGPLNNPWYMTGEAAVLASKELPFVRPPHVEWTGVSQGDIAMMMGGYASEKLTFGDITTGANSDIKQATGLAKRLITQYGMSKKLSPRTYGEKEEI